MTPASPASADSVALTDASVTLFTVSTEGTTMRSETPSMVPDLPDGSATEEIPRTPRSLLTVASAAVAWVRTSNGVSTPEGTPPRASTS
jgi:hypothetical protein